MSVTYGVSAADNYAVVRGSHRTEGVWDAVEVDGDLYRVVDFDSIPECDWDRIEKLESSLTRGAPASKGSAGEGAA